MEWKSDDFKALLNLIELIHSAPLEDDGWQRVLIRLRDLTGSTHGAIYTQHLESGHAEMIANLGWDGRQIQEYEEYYASRSIMNDEIVHHPSGEIYLDQMFRDYESLKKCEVYNDFFVPTRTEHMALSQFMRDDGRAADLVLRRGKNQGRYDFKICDQIGVLIPHLQRAFQTHRLLQKYEGFKRTLDWMTNRLPFGLFFLDESGRVLEFNDAAEEILRRKDGLYLSREGLCRANSAHETRELRRCIARAIHIGQGKGGRPDGFVSLSRNVSEQAYTVQIAPIFRRVALRHDRHPAVALFVFDPQRSQAPTEELLAKLYGLTRAEGRLAALLVQGFSLQESAEQLQVSQNTVRTQLKSIFAKTGVNRQAELIRMLLSRFTHLRESKFQTDSSRIHG